MNINLYVLRKLFLVVALILFENRAAYYPPLAGAGCSTYIKDQKGSGQKAECLPAGRQGITKAGIKIKLA